MQIPLSTVLTGAQEIFKRHNSKKYFLLNKLYIPYLILYDKHHLMAAMPFTDLEEKEKDEIIDLLSSNYIYIRNDRKLCDLVHEFLSYNSDRKFGIKDNIIDDDTINESYYNLTDYISGISRKQLDKFAPFSQKMYNPMNFKLVNYKFSFKLYTIWDVPYEKIYNKK